MGKKKVFDTGETLERKLTAMQHMLTPTDSDITAELMKQNYYTGYQEGVYDALKVFLSLLKEAKG